MSEFDDKSGATSGKGQLTPAVQWERYGRYPYLLAKLIFFGLLGAGVLWVLNALSAVVFPVFMSVLLAYVLNPAVGILQKRGIPRTLGIVALMAAVIVFVTVFSWFLYPTMADQVQKISERAPQAIEVLEERTFPWFGETFDVELPSTWAEVAETYQEEIRNALPAVTDQLGDWTGELVSRTRVLLISLFNLVMIPIFTFYFLRDFERGKKQLEEFVPDWKKDAIYNRFRKMDHAVGQWFRGQIEVSLILAVLYAIGLGGVYWATGHDPQSGVVIGLLTGFLNVVPYLGFAVGSILAFLVVLIDWSGWAGLIGVAVAFTVIQLAESYYITPRVMGQKLGLKPVTVIIVLLIGGHAAGLLGVLLAIPFAAGVKVLFPDIIRWYQLSSLYTGVPMRPASAGRLMYSERLRQTNYSEVQKSVEKGGPKPTEDSTTEDSATEDSATEDSATEDSTTGDGTKDAEETGSTPSGTGSPKSEASIEPSESDDSPVPKPDDAVVDGEPRKRGDDSDDSSEPTSE